MLRRIVILGALSGLTLITLAPAANATGAASGTTTTFTQSTVSADWSTDLVSSGAGFTAKSWHVEVQVTSGTGSPRAMWLGVGFCVYHYNANQKFLHGRCTDAQATTGFTFSLDSTKVRHASLRAVDVPAQKCPYNEFGVPIGNCLPASIDVTAAWTGQGPITYRKYIEYVPGQYKIVDAFKLRGADVSATFNGTAPSGQLGPYSSFGTEVLTEWVNN